MALLKGTNSYVDLDDAEAYFEDRLDVAAWLEADESQRSQALVTAAHLLDNLDWVGVAVSTSQPMAFPRTGSYFDPRVGLTVNMVNITPVRVKRAQMELAYHLLLNDGLTDETGGLETLELSGLVLRGVKEPSTLPKMVYDLVRPLLFGKGQNMWWRAN